MMCITYSYSKHQLYRLVPKSLSSALDIPKPVQVFCVD